MLFIDCYPDVRYSISSKSLANLSLFELPYPQEEKNKKQVTVRWWIRLFGPGQSPSYNIVLYTPNAYNQIDFKIKSIYRTWG